MGEARSYLSGKPMVKYTRDKIINLLLNRYDGRRVYLLSPLVKTAKAITRSCSRRCARRVI